MKAWYEIWNDSQLTYQNKTRWDSIDTCSDAMVNLYIMGYENLRIERFTRRTVQPEWSFDSIPKAWFGPYTLLSKSKTKTWWAINYGVDTLRDVPVHLILLWAKLTSSLEQEMDVWPTYLENYPGRTRFAKQRINAALETRACNDASKTS